MSTELLDICQHCKQPVFSGGRPVVFGSGFEIDPIKLYASLDGVRLKLTPNEFEIMYLLVSRKGAVTSIDAIFNAIWGDSDVETQIVNVLVCRLRKKIGAAKIVNVWGKGFRLGD